MLKKDLLVPIETIAVIGGIGALSLLAFSKKQRVAIRERDGNVCNFPDHLVTQGQECQGRLEVHHIIPQRYAKRMGIDPDYPINAITVCQKAHQEIHPDYKEALEKYRSGNSESFAKVGEIRDSLLDQREICWDPAWDRPMTIQAVRNTQKAERSGWKFPNTKK